MKFRQTNSIVVAAAKASISLATAYRIEGDPRPPSQKAKLRQRRRPDPLADVFHTEIVPMLEVAPGLRSVAIFEEIMHRRLRTESGLNEHLGRHKSVTGPVIFR